MREEEGVLAFFLPQTNAQTKGVGKKRPCLLFAVTRCRSAVPGLSIDPDFNFLGQSLGNG